MKNGGTIRVRQTHHFHAAPTYTYTPGDAPMNTMEQLQALLAEKATGVLESIDVNILFTRFPKKEVAHD